MSNQDSLATYLSFDVLFEIFSQLMGSYDLAKDWFHIFHDQVCLSHVCSKWRQAARECKPLWTSIPAFNHEWTEVALQLSTPLPIDVTIIGEYVDYAPSRVFNGRSLPALLAETYRMRSLFLHDSEWDGSDGEIIKAIDQISKKETPLLERVELYGAMDFVDDYPHSLQNFFSIARPKMLYMTLSGTLFSCIGLCLTSLTQLRLEEARFTDTPHDFLIFLSKMPSLSVLSIKHSLYHMSEERSSLVLRSISLPELTEFIFTELPTAFSRIVPYILIPPRATIVLEIYSIHPSTDFLSIASTLKHHFDLSVQDGATFRDVQILPSKDEEYKDRLVLIAKDLDLNPRADNIPIAGMSQSNFSHKLSPIPPTLLKMCLSAPSERLNPSSFSETIVAEIMKYLPILFGTQRLSIDPSGPYFPLQPLLSEPGFPSEVHFWSSLLEHLGGVEILEISATSWVSVSRYISMAAKDAALVLRLRELYVRNLSRIREAGITQGWMAVLRATEELSHNSLRLIKIELGDGAMPSELPEDLRGVVEVIVY